MFLSNTKIFRLIASIVLCNAFSFGYAQQITGVWAGRIDKRKVEVKIVQKGDSLTGTSYYYESNGNYRRYSIKGYFDPYDNSVVWWDDQLIADKGNNSSKNALLSVADFNCPGGGAMKLDGKSAPKEDRENLKGPVALTKSNSTSFTDEWDFVIENYTVGMNDPDIIDSVGLIAFTRKEAPRIVSQPKPATTQIVETDQPKTTTPAVTTIDTKPQTIEQKFTIRKKVFVTEIPIQGDSIELRFFDNVQVDGDSITLFLNDKMIFTHIRLTEKPFVVKLPVKDLNDTNELTMVAENLGAIPPNTAYMVAIVGDKHYDVNLSSTEETSGMIRLKKASLKPTGGQN
jgi:hypothetical protein